MSARSTSGRLRSGNSQASLRYSRHSSESRAKDVRLAKAASSLPAMTHPFRLRSRIRDGKASIASIWLLSDLSSRRDGLHAEALTDREELTAFATTRLPFRCIECRPERASLFRHVREQDEVSAGTLAVCHDAISNGSMPFQIGNPRRARVADQLDIFARSQRPAFFIKFCPNIRGFAKIPCRNDGVVNSDCDRKAVGGGVPEGDDPYGTEDGRIIDLQLGKLPNCSEACPQRVFKRCRRWLEGGVKPQRDGTDTTRMQTPNNGKGLGFTNMTILPVSDRHGACKSDGRNRDL